MLGGISGNPKIDNFKRYCLESLSVVQVFFRQRRTAVMIINIYPRKSDNSLSFSHENPYRINNWCMALCCENKTSRKRSIENSRTENFRSVNLTSFQLLIQVSCENAWCCP